MAPRVKPEGDERGQPARRERKITTARRERKITTAQRVVVTGAQAAFFFRDDGKRA